MDEFIIQVLNGVADSAVTERVGRWRAESEENEAHYRAVARVWSLTEPVFAAAPSRPVEKAVIVAAAEERRRADSDVIPLDPEAVALL